MRQSLSEHNRFRKNGNEQNYRKRTAQSQEQIYCFIYMTLGCFFSNNRRCYEADNFKQDEKVVCVRHLSENCMSTKYSRTFQQSCKYSNPSQPSVISIRVPILKVVPKQGSLFIIYLFQGFHEDALPCHIIFRNSEK